MTTENNNPTENNKPAFYIFAQGEDGKDKLVGSVFLHDKGKGFNIVIDGKRYKAHPPKPKPAATPKVGA